MSRYIDKEKFKERIQASPIFPNMGQDGYFVRELITDLVDIQPTADVVEVKHGEWIRVESSDMSTGIATKCSECNKMRYGSWLPPYCAICGAKMDGKRSEGDD